MEQKKYSPSDGEYYNAIVNIEHYLKDKSILEYANGSFSFYYVGLISLPSYIIVVLPKYTSHLLPRHDYEMQTRTLVKALQRFTNSLESPEGNDFLSITADDPYFSEPALANSIIEHYLNYGIWEKHERAYHVNATGSINWDLTVNYTQPLIAGKSLFYPETYNSVSLTASEQIIALIHKWATKYCIEKYSRILPDYEGLIFNDDAPDNLDQIGEPEVLINILQSELRQVYVDVKVNLLTNLIWLIQQNSSTNSSNQITFYGTTAFHLVWEAACKTAFADMSSHQSIRNLFKSPVWKHRENGGQLTEAHNKKNRLIPDVVWFASIDGKTILKVMDAKYYSIRVDKGTIRDNPGIADISKQVLYQQVLTKSPGSPFFECSDVVNAFIFPRLIDNVENYGPVDDTEAWLWGHIDSNIPGWEHQPILVLMVPPSKMLDSFIYDQCLPEKDRLKLFNNMTDLRNGV